MIVIPRVLQAGFQSGSIMLASDMTTQLLIEGRGTFQNEDDGIMVNAYDPSRTLRWASAGLLLHGPYFYTTFSALDKAFGPSKTFRDVVKKTVGAQILVFPPYLFILFGFLGLLEGHRDRLLQHIAQRVPDAFLIGCIFWPAANLVNFSIVPATMRVPYLASVGSIWNIFLSWLNNKKKTKSGTDGGGVEMEKSGKEL